MSQQLFEAENKEAEEHISQGRIAAAARILVTLVEKDNANYRAFNNMGIISWLQKAWDDAYLMFERALTIKPDYSDAIVNLFDAALKLKRIDRARPFFEKAAAADPLIEEAIIIRDAIREQGEKIYECERALMVGTFNPLIDEGEKLIREGLLIRAMEKFLKVNDTEGPNADALSGLGTIAYYQQNYADAYTLFLQSIKLNPAKTDNFLNLLDAAKNCDKIAEAQKIYTEFALHMPSLKSITGYFENPSTETPSGT